MSATRSQSPAPSAFLCTATHALASGNHCRAGAGRREGKQAGSGLRHRCSTAIGSRGVAPARQAATDLGGWRPPLARRGGRRHDVLGKRARGEQEEEMAMEMRMAATVSDSQRAWAQARSARPPRACVGGALPQLPWVRVEGSSARLPRPWG